QTAPIQTALAQPALSQPAMDTTAESAQPQTRTVRYTTNMPEVADSNRGQKLARSLNVDSVNPNSRAGAGLAAYHAAQAGQNMSAAQNAQPQVVPPTAPKAPTVPTAPTAPASFAIPPLTADSLNS
ncbi:MAG: peptidase M23, partial [Desulfovibrionaceae bacterium]|nr:peptidase M23 [Desulfovibrionaceae bacterium]